MDKKIEFELDSNLIPTRNLLRWQRKQDYAQSKLQRKNEKAALKEREKAEKNAKKAERDQSLWKAMKKATDLENSSSS